jgi:hypothetical protein
MEANRRGHGGEQRRPLLAGGEHLSAALDRPNTWGPKRHPRSIEEAIALLTPQVEEVQERVASTPAEMRGARVVFEAKILPNYLANSNFPRDLFAEADLVPVGTRGAVGEYTTPQSPPEQRETKSYLLAGDERSLSRLGGLLRGELGTSRAAERAFESLRQFDAVRLPSAEETLRGLGELSGEAITWEAVFHPAVDGAGEVTALERDAVWEKWSSLVEGLGGELATAYRRQIKGLTFVPVRLPTDAGPLAAAFNPLRTLRPMPTVRPMPVSPLRVLDRQAPDPPPGERPQSDLRVAVFDGGVDAGASQLTPFLTVTDLSPEPPDPGDVEHGTLVSASTLFGANHADGELSTPEVGVDHFRVLPVPPEEGWDLDLYWLLDRITEQVRGGGYRLVNLSLGPSQCLEEDIEPHAWTAVLDELAEELGVLFITAVGNNGEHDATIGAHRIQAPSDMVNGIGVGACDARPPDAPWARAPYSAWGPGRPGARMQPTGVAFGGTDATPFRGITSAGRVAETAGTSFATPVAMHGLSALAAQLGTVGTDPSVLRAFAAHGAEQHAEGLHDEVGFGRLLERYDGVLDCAPNEATILYRDEIARGQMLSLPFPLPEQVVAGRMVTLTWTIAFAAPTDPKDPVDYTKAGIEASFRPHAETFTFTHPETKHSQTVNLAANAREATDLMGQGYVPSSLPKTAQHGRYRHETLRRKEDGKWESLLRAGVRKRATSLLRPQATIVYLAREDGDRLAAAPPLGFAMLLTMRAGNRDLPLYDAVRASYQVLQPLRAQLPLRLQT